MTPVGFRSKTAIIPMAVFLEIKLLCVEYITLY